MIDKSSMKTSHLSLKIFILSSFALGCGREYDTGGFTGERIGERVESRKERNLRPEELSIAQRICESYRAKWVDFRFKIDEEFNYRYSSSLCNSTKKEIDPFSVKLIKSSTREDAPLIFDSSEFIDYVQVMQTHMHGELAVVCDPIMKRGEVPPLTYDTNDGYLEFAFESQGDDDVYVVYKIQDDDEEESRVFEEGRYRVRTKSGDPNRGLVMLSKRVKMCSDESFEEKATMIQEAKL